MISLAIPANAHWLERNDFYDWDYALQVWNDMKTLEEGLTEWERVMPAYEAWQKQHGDRPRAGEAEIANNDQAAVIKAGHDLALVHRVWSHLYQEKYRPWAPPSPWNEIPVDGRLCDTISKANIFTGSCNDLPDWRPASARDRDQERLERAQNAQAN